MPRAKTIVTELLAAADVRCDGAREWDIDVRDERFYPRVLSDGNLGLGESYMDGWWHCASLADLFFRLVRAGLGDRVSLGLRTAAAWTTSWLRSAPNRRRSRAVGRRHYDLGNDFFAAMLDPAMQYSCACFHGTDDLAEAQRIKMELICRKLGLAPGMRLLDIGCGWGGLARHAVEQHGCEVVGITISEAQQTFAQDAARGLPIEIRLQDYRDVDEPFDRIVSVGMLEHVCRANYRRYMRVAHRCLAPGGLFLCHSIGNTRSRHGTDAWINRYIFPHSMLPSPGQITRAAEGLFVLEDVHNIGAHYDRTLRAWEANVRLAWPRFRDRFGERFLRMWRYYLLSCAGAFRARDLEVYQFVFSKGGVGGGYVSIRL